MVNKTTGKPNSNNTSKSNTVRTILFMFVIVLMGVYIVANMNNNSAQKTEVPISEVITRANDPEGDISKITVTGSTLDITVKGKDQPTETSRKDGSGTLYDQGLINYCEKLEGDDLKKCEETYPII